MFNFLNVPIPRPRYVGIYVLVQIVSGSNLGRAVGSREAHKSISEHDLFLWLQERILKIANNNIKVSISKHRILS